MAAWGMHCGNLYMYESSKRMHKQDRCRALSFHIIMPERHGWPYFINMHEDMHKAHAMIVPACACS